MVPSPMAPDPVATDVHTASTFPVTAPSRRDTPRWRGYTLPGCWGALFFACLSFTPSLLPRSGLVQGLVCGITAAIGYGLGVLGGGHLARLRRP